MALHGLFRDGELPRNILVAAAFHNALNDFQFTRRKTVRLALGNRCSFLHQLMQRLQQVRDALAADPVITLQHCP